MPYILPDMQLCVMGMIEEDHKAVCVTASHSGTGTSIATVIMLKMPHNMGISLLMTTLKSVNLFIHHITTDLLIKVALPTQPKEYLMIMQHGGITVILPFIHKETQQ